MKDKNLLKNIIGIVERYFKHIIIGFLIVGIASPVVVWLCYSVFPCRIVTDITADGMLSYMGCAISGFMTLLVSLIALWHSDVSAEKDMKLADEQHRREICPCLYVTIREDVGELLTLVIENFSEYPAFNIHLAKDYFAQIIRGNSFISGYINADGKHVIQPSVADEYEKKPPSDDTKSDEHNKGSGLCNCGDPQADSPQTKEYRCDQTAENEEKQIASPCGVPSPKTGDSQADAELEDHGSTEAQDKDTLLKATDKESEQSTKKDSSNKEKDMEAQMSESQAMVTPGNVLPPLIELGYTDVNQNRIIQKFTLRSGQQGAFYVASKEFYPDLQDAATAKSTKEKHQKKRRKKDKNTSKQNQVPTSVS